MALRELFSVITTASHPTLLVFCDLKLVLDERDSNRYAHRQRQANVDALPFFSVVQAGQDAGVRAHLRVNFIGTKCWGRYDDFIRERGLHANVRYVSDAGVPGCASATSRKAAPSSSAIFLCTEVGEHEALWGTLRVSVHAQADLAPDPPGPDRRHPLRSGLGTVVDPNDKAGMKKVLREPQTAWRDGHTAPALDEGYLGEFDRSGRPRAWLTLRPLREPTDLRPPPMSRSVAGNAAWWTARRRVRGVDDRGVRSSSSAGRAQAAGCPGH